MTSWMLLIIHLATGQMTQMPMVDSRTCLETRWIIVGSIGVTATERKKWHDELRNATRGVPFGEEAWKTEGLVFSKLSTHGQLDAICIPARRTD